LVITTLITYLFYLSAAIPFGLLCITLSSFLKHRIDLEERRLKLAIMDNSHSAWEEFDVKYKKQFEYEMERQ